MHMQIKDRVKDTCLWCFLLIFTYEKDFKLSGDTSEAFFLRRGLNINKSISSMIFIQLDFSIYVTNCQSLYNIRCSKWNIEFLSSWHIVVQPSWYLLYIDFSYVRNTLSNHSNLALYVWYKICSIQSLSESCWTFFTGIWIDAGIRIALGRGNSFSITIR